MILHTGFIMGTIRNLLRSNPMPGDRVTLDNLQQNATHGIWQGRVTLAGDPVTYRLILAPEDAPIGIIGGADHNIRIGDHFPRPLGVR